MNPITALKRTDPGTARGVRSESTPAESGHRGRFESRQRRHPRLEVSKSGSDYSSSTSNPSRVISRFLVSEAGLEPARP